MLTLFTGPSAEAIEAGNTKKEVAERYLARQRFWTKLLERAKQKTKLHAAISPGQYGWLGTTAGLPYGLGLSYVVRRHDSQVELTIDADTAESNKAILDRLALHRDEIEREFGGPLEWEALESRRACRIRKIIARGGWQDEEQWPAAHEEMIDAMIALERALRPHLKQLGL